MVQMWLILACQNIWQTRWQFMRNSISNLQRMSNVNFENFNHFSIFNRLIYFQNIFWINYLYHYTNKLLNVCQAGPALETDCRGGCRVQFCRLKLGLTMILPTEVDLHGKIRRYFKKSTMFVSFLPTADFADFEEAQGDVIPPTPPCRAGPGWRRQGKWKLGRTITRERKKLSKCVLEALLNILWRKKTHSSPR